MSTIPAHITAILAAIAITAAITYVTTRRRTAAHHGAAVVATAAHAAHRDDLTGLGNRHGFHAALTDVAGRRQPVAVILINFDGTRAFVSRLGHRALDQLLVLTVGRLQHIASAADGTAFRLRRDELAVILADPAGATGHAARLVAAVAELTEVHLGGLPITVSLTACAGVATFIPHADSDWRLVLIRADRAMRAAKASGRGQTASFGPATVRGRNGREAR
ncbi:GGDEF domain-containing protein [Dactylosporangium sp. NPDC005572]|uniref:GGDEF domain-containing protein n=1 Tax=Dactylosporangium sp. NPDC005572 TaxID=3156889 RepID=UPI0033A51E53